MKLHTVTRLPRAAALAVGLALLPVATAAGIARADAGPPTSTTASTTATTLGVMSQPALVQSVQVALDWTKVNSQLAALDQQVGDAKKLLTAAQGAFEDLDARYRAEEAQLAEAYTRLRGRAVASYERNGDLVGADLEVQQVQNLAVGAQYVNAAAVVDTTAVDRLQKDLTAIQAAHDERAQQVRDLEAQLTSLNTQHDVLSARAQGDQASLDQLGGVTVLGPAQLTAAQLAAWYRSTGAHARLSGATTIDELTQLYLAEGNTAGVRGDLAFAQAIIETGSFEHATDNNYAGIGACDSCTGEPAFPTPEAGVRAQVQLLRSYADPDSTATNLGNPPDPTLFGADPVAAAGSFDTFFLKGKVPLWNQMGHGNWATDPNYAGKVLRIYEQMLAYADH